MRILIYLLLLHIPVGLLTAQDIQTAVSFFDELSARYGEVEDYHAELRITREESESTGTIEYRIPNQVRVDFEEPAGQVLVSDGELLQVYIPEHNVVLEQSLRRRSEGAIATLANEQGLNLLRQNYSIAYLDTPEAVPLDEGSDEMVIKLRLNWRNSNEGYRQLIISVDDDMLIRRIIGVTASYEEIQFDFEDVVVNRGIPDSRFDYEAPSSANTFDSFLFEREG
ncbi:MAG: outer membrane lipoprotein carrier protein LolA [Spirochaeta sp.]|nr:outer membrane lipoprotein carrier protein LolA [Spirochaeta sp.]